jgi:hypothetical protein
MFRFLEFVYLRSEILQSSSLHSESLHSQGSARSEEASKSNKSTARARLLVEAELRGGQHRLIHNQYALY